MILYIASGRDNKLSACLRPTQRTRKPQNNKSKTEEHLGQRVGTGQQCIVQNSWTARTGWLRHRGRTDRTHPGEPSRPEVPRAETGARK